MGLDTFNANVVQPEPTGNGKDVTALVIADLSARSEAGAKKYGTKLKTFNGRDATVDLYQELLDAVCYLRQLIEEKRDGATNN